MNHPSEMSTIEASSTLAEIVRNHGLHSVLAMVSSGLPQGMKAESRIINEAADRVFSLL